MVRDSRVEDWEIKYAPIRMKDPKNHIQMQLLWNRTPYPEDMKGEAGGVNVENISDIIKEQQKIHAQANNVLAEQGLKQGANDNVADVETQGGLHEQTPLREYDEIRHRAVVLDEAEAAALANVMTLSQKGDEKLFNQYFERYKSNPASFETLVSFANWIEGSMKWPRNKEAYDQAVNDITHLYSAIERGNPEGYVVSDTSRVKSIEQIGKIFEGHDSDSLVMAVNFIKDLGGNNQVGPAFAHANTDNSARYRWQAHSRGKGTQTPTIHLNANPNAQAITPDIMSVFHETAHWAYQHILTPQDKIDFWIAMEKYYNDKGELDMERVHRDLPFWAGMKVGIKQRDGFFNKELPADYNQDKNPAELFAIQFEKYIFNNNAGKEYLTPLSEMTFWQKMVQFVKAIFDRYFLNQPIDPTLERLFAKILPSQEAKKFQNGTDINNNSIINKDGATSKEVAPEAVNQSRADANINKDILQHQPVRDQSGKATNAQLNYLALHYNMLTEAQTNLEHALINKEPNEIINKAKDLVNALIRTGENSRPSDGSYRKLSGALYAYLHGGHKGGNAKPVLKNLHDKKYSLLDIIYGDWIKGTKGEKPDFEAMDKALRAANVDSSGNRIFKDKRTDMTHQEVR